MNHLEHGVHAQGGGGYGPPPGPPPGPPGGYGPPGVPPGGYGPPGGGGPPGGYGGGPPGGYGPPGSPPGGYGGPPPGGYGGPPGGMPPPPGGHGGPPGGYGGYPPAGPPGPLPGPAADLKKQATTWLIVSVATLFVCGNCFGLVGGILCFLAMQAADQNNVPDGESKLKWGKIITIVGAALGLAGIVISFIFALIPMFLN